MESYNDVGEVLDDVLNLAALVVLSGDARQGWAQCNGRHIRGLR